MKLGNYADTKIKYNFLGIYYATRSNLLVLDAIPVSYFARLIRDSQPF